MFCLKGWHCKEVVIESQSDGRKWFVDVNRWFDLKEDDGKIERELLALEQPNTQKRIVYDDYESQAENRKFSKRFDDIFNNYNKKQSNFFYRIPLTRLEFF